jgi:hypothetical protein
MQIERHRSVWAAVTLVLLIPLNAGRDHETVLAQATPITCPSVPAPSVRPNFVDRGARVVFTDGPFVPSSAVEITIDSLQLPANPGGIPTVLGRAMTVTQNADARCMLTLEIDTGALGLGCYDIRATGRGPSGSHSSRARLTVNDPPAEACPIPSASTSPEQPATAPPAQPEPPPTVAETEVSDLDKAIEAAFLAAAGRSISEVNDWVDGLAFDPDRRNALGEQPVREEDWHAARDMMAGFAGLFGSQRGGNADAILDEGAFWSVLADRSGQLLFPSIGREWDSITRLSVDAHEDDSKLVEMASLLGRLVSADLASAQAP